MDHFEQARNFIEVVAASTFTFSYYPSDQRKGRYLCSFTFVMQMDQVGRKGCLTELNQMDYWFN